MLIKLVTICMSTMILMSCVARSDRFAQRTPEEVSRWSDEELCRNGYWENPAIKTELLRRNLLTEKEFEYLFMSDEHQHFPRVGMRKCAMWAFTNGGELVSRSTTPDGKVHELWKVHRGEYIISKSTGGRYYLITIENDRITNVSMPLDK